MIPFSAHVLIRWSDLAANGNCAPQISVSVAQGRKDLGWSGVEGLKCGQTPLALKLQNRPLVAGGRMVEGPTTLTNTWSSRCYWRILFQRAKFDLRRQMNNRYSMEVGNREDNYDVMVSKSTFTH